MKDKTYFITGATGLMGSYLTKLILKDNHKVYCLARDKGGKSAKDRVIEALNFWDNKVLESYAGNLKVVKGDIGKEGLGLSRDDEKLIEKEVNEIFHCAAVTRFNWPLDKIRKVNTEGTKEILELALKCANLKKVNHISTAYVCGKYRGVFSEADLDKGQEFNTTYEQSKFEAEKLVGEYREKGLWIDIFRPPLIIGESTTGKINVVQGFYQTLHYWRLEIFDVFPGKSLKINIVPVDLLCKAIMTISSASSIKNSAYHPFHYQAPFLKDILDIAAEYGKFKKPELVTGDEFSRINLTPVQRMILEDNIFDYNPYIVLDSKYTIKILSEYGFNLPVLSRNSIVKIISYPFSSR